MKKFSSVSASFALAMTVIISSFSIAAPVEQPQTGDQGKVNGSLKKGDDLYKAGKFKEAIDAYKEALNQDPNNDQAIGYIAYSYNKLGDNASALQWMKRRVEIPGQSPSKKAQTLTEITVLYWFQAHVEITTHASAPDKNSQAEDAKKLLNEGIDTGQKAVTIAPRSVKGFNLLNLLYRDTASIEVDAASRTEMLAKADDALRKSIQFFEALPEQPSSDYWAVPTLSTVNGTGPGKNVQLGAATKRSSPDVLKNARDGSVVIEVLVGRDGKVRFQRVLSGQGKPGDVALGSARQWEFQPSTFEGHTVQVIETISFPAK